MSSSVERRRVARPDLMEQRRSQRSSTYAPELVDAADRAEQRGVDRFRHRRLAWVAVYIEIVSIAESAKKHDLSATWLHAAHLVGALLRLGLEGAA